MILTAWMRMGVVKLKTGGWKLKHTEPALFLTHLHRNSFCASLCLFVANYCQPITING